MKAENIGAIKRGLAVWLVIIAAEFLHAIARVIFLEPSVGDFRARQIAVFTGILIIFAISYLFIEWIRADGNFQLLMVGLLWLGLTAAFEISLGRLMNLSWTRILSDYDLTNGGLMLIGLCFLTLSPLLAARLKRRFPPKHHENTESM